MKATELRIGNIVARKSNGNILRVDSEFLSHPEYIEKNFEPVKLDKEWLGILGFDKKGFLETGSEQAIQIEGTRFYLFGPDSVISGQCFSNNIQSVHQLQNLYFALTGTELTSNLLPNG